jgi:hypothetical protein
VIFLDRREAYLYETKGEIRPYAALSHCWQDSQPLQTMKQNLKDHMGRLVWNILPLAFRESFELVKALGIQYIWIDSLCIVQDDDDNWKTQAMRMASIYENAKITIALHQEEKNASSFPTTVAMVGSDANVQVNVQLSQVPLKEEDIEKTRLSSRGWCFQERLLSTRILHCLPSGIVFECNQGKACDCMADEPHHHLDSEFKTLFTEEHMTGSNWRQLVTRFSQKSLTYQTDILPALSGITNRVREAGRYYGGSWEKFMEYDLLWFSALGLPGSQTDFPIRPDEFIAPSFLWPSVKGHISFVDLERDKRYEPTFSIMEISCMPKNYDPLGQLHSGMLVWHGQFIRATFVNCFERPMPADAFIKDCQPELRCLWATLKNPWIGHYIFHPDSLDLRVKNLVCLELFSPKERGIEPSYALVVDIGDQDVTEPEKPMQGKRVGIVASIESRLFVRDENAALGTVCIL